MDFNSQLDQIRKKHNQKYSKIAFNNEREKKLKQFGEKYGPMIELNKVRLAAIRIVRFFKKYVFNDCYYDISCGNDTAGLNCYRILFTTHNILEDIESDYDDDPELRRAMNMNLNEKNTETILFRYCFELNYIYQRRNDIINVNNLELILTENDIIRLERNWNKMYGETVSAIFITDLDYIKSLVCDQMKDDKFIDKFISQYSK